MSGRYAVYFAPARLSRWWTFGAGWLGRDDILNQALAQPALPGLDGTTLARITAEPRRYGFHATLKAPFRLRDSVTEGELRERMRMLAQGLRAVPLGRLVPVDMDGFVALVPTAPPAGLQPLASHCVVALDDARAPLTPAERARRRIAPDDARAAELLECYGYPHVLERFRFHMTLTGPVDRDTADSVLAQLTDPVTQLNALEPAVLDRLCLFAEPAPGEPFTRLAEVELPA